MNIEEYTRPEPRQPEARLSEWFSPAKRGVGGWAFLLHRFTGIVLVLYLVLHFYVLSYLARGPKAYQAALNFLENPIFVALEVALIAAVIYHGLNGLRLILMAYNIGVKQQKAMFWMVFVLSALTTFVVAVYML